MYYICTLFVSLLFAVAKTYKIFIPEQVPTFSFLLSIILVFVSLMNQIGSKLFHSLHKCMKSKQIFIT